MQNRLKPSLLIFVNIYAPKMESFVYNHIKKICELNQFEVTVLCNGYSDKTFTIDKSVNIIHTEIYSLKRRVMLTLKLLFSSPLLFLRILFLGSNVRNLSLFALAYKLKGKKIDIVHAHFGHNGKMISELIKSGVLKAKLLTQFHGLDITSEKCKADSYYKTLKKQIDVALINSEYSKGKLLELGFSESKTVKIPVGTNAELFINEAKTKSAKPFVITFVGRLIELKGAQLLPEIAQKMLEAGFEDFQINIIGKGPLMEKIVQASQSLSDKINVMGFKTPNEVKEILAATNVVIYPGIKDAEGREETQGLIVQEAMFMSLPVVVTDVGGVAESVIDGETGFVCEPKNLVQIAEKIVFLANNPQQSLKMGEKALALAKSKYDLTSIIKQYELLYQKLITKS